MRKDELRAKAVELGVDLFGVASALDFDDAPKGHRPTDILPDAKSVIVLGMKYLDTQVDILPVRQEEAFFLAAPRQEMYAGHNDAIARELDVSGLKLARFLERTGFKAYHQMSSRGGVDNRFLMSLLSLKHMAVKAGLGVLGYNTLVLTPEYGPRVRLTAIVSNVGVEKDDKLDLDFCSSCRGKPCITLCPAKALNIPEGNQSYNIDKFACGTYLRTRPACSICMKVCPIGSENR